MKLLHEKIRILINLRISNKGGKMNNKKVFTTGEIAKLIHVHQTTVIDWVDKKMMQSYKTPGGHRRISKEALLGFLNSHEMPIPNILINEAPSNDAEEKHRHLHESFQVNPYSQPKPASALPHLPKHIKKRATAPKAELAQKKKSV